MHASIVALSLTPIVFLLVLVFVQRVRLAIATWIAESLFNSSFFALIVLAWQADLELMVTGTVHKSFFWFAAYLTVVVFFTSYLKRREEANWRDLVIIGVLYLPPILGIVSFDTDMPKLWGLRIPYGLVAAYILVLVQVRRGIAISFRRPDKSDLAVFLRTLLAVLAIVVPLGIGTGFLNPGLNAFRSASLGVLGVICLNVLLKAALPEEVIFRGHIQSLLENRFGMIFGFLAASVIFGLSHVVHRVTTAYGVFNAPNWCYACLATICGLGYGYLYMRTRSLFLPMALHLVVDVVWVVFFTNPHAMIDQERFLPFFISCLAAVAVGLFLFLTDRRYSPKIQKSNAAA